MSVNEEKELPIQTYVFNVLTPIDAIEATDNHQPIEEDKGIRESYLTYYNYLSRERHEISKQLDQTLMLISTGSLFATLTMMNSNWAIKNSPVVSVLVVQWIFSAYAILCGLISILTSQHLFNLYYDQNEIKYDVHEELKSRSAISKCLEEKNTANETHINKYEKLNKAVNTIHLLFTIMGAIIAVVYVVLCIVRKM